MLEWTGHLQAALYFLPNLAPVVFAALAWERPLTRKEMSLIPWLLLLNALAAGPLFIWIAPLPCLFALAPLIVASIYADLVRPATTEESDFVLQRKIVKRLDNH